MKIVSSVIKPISIKKEQTRIWEEALEKDTSLSFFHTIEWYELWAKYYRSRFEIFRLSADLFMPVLLKNRAMGLVQERHAGPRGTYGLLIGQKIDSNNPISLPPNFYVRHFQENLFFSKNIKKEYTKKIYLKDAPQFHKNHRRILSKGDLRVEYTENIEDWKSYYEIYSLSHRRWQLSKVSYEWNLFAYIFALKNVYRKLWIVRHDNKVIAGAVCFYFNKTVNYWNGATDYTFKEKSPGHFLQKSIIDHAKSNNFEIYDMGNSTGLPGVDRFKAGFGAVQVPNYLYYNESITLKAVNKLRNIIK